MSTEPAQKPRISVVITDLDNTLFDWVAMWGAAFRAMLDEIVRISGLTEDELLPAIRKIHQLHHTSEYTFLIADLPPLQSRFPGQDLNAVFASASAAYRAARDKSLRLYPGVLDTLLRLRASGVLVVGYTESHHFVTMWRIQRLGLDGLLDFVYSPPDHAISGNVELGQMRSRPDDAYSLKLTQHRNTPKGEYKPNPRILGEIVADIGRPPREAVYVGDNLMKDVAMAQLAGVLDVHAEYGHAHNTAAYSLLKQVTHWTDADVQREKDILQGRDVAPTYVLREGFGGIMELFEFGPPPDGGIVQKDRISWAMEAWKKTVDVQQHFNDLQLRIRTFSITFLAALLSVAGLVFKEDKASRLPAYLVFLGIPALAAFWFMDRHMYHRLLKGVGEHAGAVETQIARMSGLQSFGLSTQVSKASRVEPAWYTLKKEVRSTQKLNLFYGALALVMLLMSIGFYVNSRRGIGPTEVSPGASADSSRGGEARPLRDSSIKVVQPDSVRSRADTTQGRSRQAPPR